MPHALTLQDFWAPIALYAFATSASPGPVNMVAATSGTHFGVRRTLPQVLGASLGFSLLLLAIGLGLGTVFQALPWLYQVMRVIGSLFLCYLAWKLWHASAAPAEAARVERPPGFIEGLAAQWLNPKAWIVAIAGIAAYTTPGESYLVRVTAMAAVFLVVCFPSVGAWAVFGAAARRLMKTERAIHRFNGAMALLLVASIVLLFI